jgi:AcrR family transcriptional regulator
MEVGTAAWWESRVRRRERSARRRRRGLNSERITTTALEFIDEHGLEELTVRALANELGTGHASLYRHIESRDALLVEVFDHALGEINLPPRDLPWREHSEQLAREFRRVLRRHPALLTVVGPARLLGPNALAVSDAALVPLVEQDVPPPLAARAFFAVLTFVVGVTLLDFRVGPQGAIAGGLDDLPASSHGYQALETAIQPSSEFQLGNFVDFEFGLTALLDGIERAVFIAQSAVDDQVTG